TVARPVPDLAEPERAGAGARSRREQRRGRAPRCAGSGGGRSGRGKRSNAVRAADRRAPDPGRPVEPHPLPVPGPAGMRVSAASAAAEAAGAQVNAPHYVRAIAPYQGGRPIEEVALELGLDPGSIVKLASNENPLGMPAGAREAAAAALADVGRYPDGNASAL